MPKEKDEASKSFGRNLTPLLQKALEVVPREQWTQSQLVGKAYLECPRLNNMIRTIMRKRERRGDRVTVEDIQQDTWFIFLTGIQNLDHPKNVYSWLYRTAELMLLTATRDVDRIESLENMASTGPAGEEESFADRVGMENGSIDLEGEMGKVAERLDLERGQQEFIAKINRLGWPANIPRSTDSIKRIGRKRNADKEAAAKEA